MPDKYFWLRKIAAFLHDPPYKAWYFGKKYKGKDWKRDKDVVELFQTYFHSQYPFYNPDKPKKVLGKFRKFHHIAASELKNNYFGFELKEKGITFAEGGYLFIHTLAGNHIQLTELLTLDEFALKIEPKDEIERVLKSLKGYEKSRFLNLWRFLPTKITPWINLLPVDTVLADNFARDLEVIQSAIITTWDDSISLDKPDSIKSSFLILEFGPVQNFIANARKTRDLWFSSWLISYLAWQAMKPIAEKLGPDNIVYPDLYKQPLVDEWLEKEGVLQKDQWNKDRLRLPTLPNTFLAIVPDFEKENALQYELPIKNVNEAFGKSKDELDSSWKDIVKGVKDLLIENSILTPEVEKIFDTQTNDFPFDIYWLGLKWGHDPKEVIEDYKKLLEPPRCWEFEKLWDKIKARVKNPNIGDTYALLVELAQTGLKALKYRGRPKSVEEKWQKCTLCGERSALVDLDFEELEKIKDVNKRNRLYGDHLKEFWKQISDAFPGHIKENEYLCAVCLVKRLAPKVLFEEKELDFHFPSTGSIALAPFIRRLFEKKVNFSPIERTISKLLSNNKREKIKNFLDSHFTEGRIVPVIEERIISAKINNEKFTGDFEPEWFYDESFSRFYEELKHQKNKDEIIEEKYNDRDKWAKQIEQAVNKIKAEAKEKLADEYHLPKYYAAVYLDGDNLGKWLRGEFAPKIEEIFHPNFVKAIYENEETKKEFELIKNLKRPITPAIHRAISSALRDFALEVVPSVVEENLGVVVYSGGDDTLFLMPLENLFKTLVALRKLYSGERYIGEFSNRKFESDKGFIKVYENGELKEIIRVMGTKATLSAGVAIAHYLDPLDITLSKAKAALKEAKEKGKNRAGFRLVIHSGGEQKAIVPWNFVETMEAFREAIVSGFSPRFIRILYRDCNIYETLPDAFDAEFLKFGKRGQSGYNALLCKLLNARKQNDLKPKEFLEALLIADFVVREEGGK